MSSKMSNIMFFDTETSGLPTRCGYDTYFPPEQIVKYNESRIVELAYIVADPITRREIKRVRYIIKPNGEYSTDKTFIYHGISTMKAEADGRDRRLVLDEFCNDLDSVDTIIGHNIKFDYHIVASELVRSGRPNYLASKKRVCTMNMGQDVMHMAKSPKLVNLYTHLFKKPMEGAHSALGDTLATMECYYKMIHHPINLADSNRAPEKRVGQSPIADEPIRNTIPVITEPKWTFASHKAALPEIYIGAS